MRALVCQAPGQLALHEVPPLGAPPPGWALVGVRHVGICGTDYHIFDGTQPFVAYPRIMGHEVSGTVQEVGEHVALPVGTSVVINPYLACGSCVACRAGKPNCCVRIEVLGVHRDGAMRDEVLIPATNLYPAEGLSPIEAATVEFLAIGAHAARRSMAPLGARALVIGAGPIGLGVAIFARAAGQGVTVLDRSHDRLLLAQSMGLAVIDGLGNGASEVARATGGEGFEVVYDSTGSAASMEAALGPVAHGGSLVLVGVVRGRIGFEDPELHRREATVIASRNALKLDFDQVAAALRAGEVRAERLVTHRTTLEGARRDLPLWAHRKQGLVKAVIEVGPEAWGQ